MKLTSLYYIFATLAFANAFLGNVRGQKSLIRRSATVEESPLREMMQAQFKEGKSIVWGVFQKEIDPASIPDSKTQAERVAKASKDLVNIDDEERARRKVAGLAGLAVTVTIYCGMLYFKIPFLFRAMGLYLPLSLSAGFLKSSEAGL